MSRLIRLAAAAAVGLIALAPAALPGAVHASPDRAPQYAPTMLILDASGSMQRSDPAGTMMDAAKKAVHTFVDSAPAESKVGLEVYGTGTGNTEAEKVAGCRDVQVLQRPDTLDKAALTGAVDGIQAGGWTPMGTSLRTAAAALPKTGPRSIVLVSDGDDTCSPPDPCDVARELKQQGLDLTVHAIGFAVDPKARAQLSCLAQVTGGTYTDAADGAALGRVLPRVTGAALRNYQASGTPITGTAGYRDAPVAGSGHYLDTIGQRENRYYALDVPAGGTAYFSGVMSFPRVSSVGVLDDMNNMQLHVYGHDGTDCYDTQTEVVSGSSSGVALTISKAFDGATKERTNSPSADSCRGEGRYYFELTWQQVSAGVPDRLPLELLVGIEPAATDPGPPPSSAATTLTEPSGPGTAVTGSGTLGAAAILDGSGRYTDTLWPGEFVFYRVRLDWGQDLAYRVHFDGNGARGSGAVSNISTALYSPVADSISADTTAYTGEDAVLPTSGRPIATVPIRYNNRKAADSAARKQSLAGWYYLAVKVGSTIEEGGDTPVRVRLDLTVSGTPEPGPVYATAISGGIVADRGTPTGASTTGPVNSAANKENSTNGQIVAVGIGAAAVIIVLAAVTALVILRKRRG